MSTIVSTRYVIAVRDLKASASYYEKVLGFEISELGGPGWLVFSKGACVIMAGECPDDTPAGDLGSHSYFAYLQVDTIDEYYKTVRDAGGDFIKPLQDESWGMREFGVRTLDGHRMMFGQPIKE